MRYLKTWPVAAAALGGLLVLIAISLLATARKAEDIYADLDELNSHHRQIEATLRRLRSDVHLSGIFIRDYLLDPARERAPEYRARLTQLRASHTDAVAELRRLTRDGGKVHVDSLAGKVDEYWEAFEPLFDWNLLQKVLNSASFLRREVLPRRDAVLAIAQEIEELNDTNLAAQRASETRRQEAFRNDLRRLLWQSMLAGIIVSLAAVLRLRVAEQRSEQQRERAEQAEEHMRQLSHGLVSTQEEERRKLSRELHDHVGQMLTALRMALGRAERVPSTLPRAAALTDAREIAEELLQTVRDLSLGLRPSMLDDFGLGPALEWLVRDFQRRAGIDVRLTVAGPVSGLADAARTCIYRVVQEALTNCARHAAAARIDIDVRYIDRDVVVTVRDDGRGMPADSRRGRGLGLTGIEERARELGGDLQVTSAPGRGTALTVRVPLPPATEETSGAVAAG